MWLGERWEVSLAARACFNLGLKGLPRVNPAVLWFFALPDAKIHPS